MTKQEQTKKKKNLNFRFKKRKESYKQIFPIILTKLVKKQVSFNFFFFLLLPHAREVLSVCLPARTSFMSTGYVDQPGKFSNSAVCVYGE